jgi:hypothetical protein
MQTCLFAALGILLVTVMTAPVALANEDICTFQTWVDSDTADMEFNKMLYLYNTYGTGKAENIISYSGSTLWIRTVDLGASGDVLYVLNYNGLEIYDISDITNPVLHSQTRLGLGSRTDRLTIDGSLMYIGQLERFYIFDISAPLNPVQVSMTYLEGHLSEIVIRDTRAFLGMVRYSNEDVNYPAMYIYDISDPANPQIVGKYESPSSMKDCRSFEVVGDFIYSINHWNSILEIISIADETHPVRIFSVDITYPYGIGVLDQYLIVANRDSLRSYDISDPDTLIERHVRVCQDTPEMVEIHDGHIYTAHGYDMDYGVMVSSYAALGGFDSLGFYDSWLYSRSMKFRDSLIFFPEGLSGFSILNCADPADLHAISSVLHPASTLYGIDVVGDTTYMTNYMSYIGQPGHNGLLIVDATDKANPSLISHTSVSGNPLSVFIYDTLAFISECQPTFIYSVADVNNPTFLAQYPIDWIQTKDNFARDTFLFMIGGEGCLEIASIADPVNPYYISRLGSDYERIGRTIIVDGNTAYIKASTYNPDGEYLRIVDISDPTNPTELSELMYSGPEYSGFSLASLCKRGNIVYIGADDRGLLAVDVTDPTEIEINGEYQLWGPDP